VELEDLKGGGFILKKVSGRVKAIDKKFPRLAEKKLTCRTNRLCVLPPLVLGNLEGGSSGIQG